jgi:hypothetical protein
LNDIQNYYCNGQKIIILKIVVRYLYRFEKCLGTGMDPRLVGLADRKKGDPDPGVGQLDENEATTSATGRISALMPVRNVRPPEVSKPEARTHLRMKMEDDEGEGEDRERMGWARSAERLTQDAYLTYHHWDYSFQHDYQLPGFT